MTLNCESYCGNWRNQNIVDCYNTKVVTSIMKCCIEFVTIWSHKILSCYKLKFDLVSAAIKSTVDKLYVRIWWRYQNLTRGPKGFALGSRIWSELLNTWPEVPKTWREVSNIWCEVLKTWHEVLNIWCEVSRILENLRLEKSSARIFSFQFWHPSILL